MKKPNKTELLLPAGNPEKLRAAFRFGADAVYLAGQRFGMRAAADNFTIQEIFDAANFAHSLSKKVYLTVNIMPHGHEYTALREYLFSLKESGIDAIMAADLGVMAAVKEILPEVELHASTQASIVSAPSAEQYYRLGCSRVVLARELSFEEIKAIRRDTTKELELEAFIHGSMCVSWSGRCLLSNHFTGRDANHGACAQPCRWNYNIYEISEEKRRDDRLPIVQTDRGTFIMSSRDMCMIEHIPELMESGIDSFKIEGRMKSAYYTAVCANSYRMAIDTYLSEGEYKYNPQWLSELESVSHRDYSTGYYFDDPMNDAKTVQTMGYVREKAYIGVIDSYDPLTNRATVIQRNKVACGDPVEVISPSLVGRPFIAQNMKDEKGNPIESAPHPFMKFSLDMPYEVSAGDIIRR